MLDEWTAVRERLSNARMTLSYRRGFPPEEVDAGVSVGTLEALLDALGEARAALAAAERERDETRPIVEAALAWERAWQHAMRPNPPLFVERDTEELSNRLHAHSLRETELHAACRAALAGRESEEAT